MSDAYADTLRTIPDSLGVILDSLRWKSDTLSAGTGNLTGDVIIPLAIIALTLGAFAALFFVRSK
jgi:hypothetical protein